ncbi:MAG: GNAT family N-acetyltransferase [Methyloceanibacter sp.]|uniref:GNAT family N-acetyltransferase n=1 Tax=Methyloceanibacter sp. TaxID=1965321 RepID=UPI003D6CDABF
MPVEILVSQAAPFDAALMASIHAACFAKAWDEAAMATFIAGPGTLCLVGYAGDFGPVPAGILIARRAADEAELLTLAVAPACRRLGLARALLIEAAEQLRTGDVKRLFLEVEEGNAAALALYRSLGAMPVGRRPAYYESGADAAIFSLALSDSPPDDGAGRR